MSKETAMAMATGVPVAPVQGTGGANETPANPNTTAAQPAAAPGDPRMQALLKKEVALVNDRAVLNRQKQEQEQRIKDADAMLARGKSFEETLAKDPVAALRLIGFSETQIFNVMAEANKEKPVKTPEEIAAETTRKILDDDKKSEAQKKAEADAKTQSEANDLAVKTSIRDLVTKPENADKLEYVVYHGEIAQEIIRETLFQLAGQAQQLAKNKGEEFVIDEARAQELLSQAAEAVEEWYFNSDKAMQAKIKKRRAITGETAAEATAAVVAQEQNQTPASANVPNEPAKQKTLTNRVSASTPAQPGARETREQKRSRLERALATGDTSLIRG